MSQPKMKPSSWYRKQGNSAVLANCEFTNSFPTIMRYLHPFQRVNVQIEYEIVTWFLVSPKLREFWESNGALFQTSSISE